MYQKEIIYISLYENEVKQSCVGYLKTETKQDKLQLELQVKNISHAFTGSFPIRIQNKTGWQETGMLMVKEGNGKWTGSMVEELLKVEILLSTSCRIKGESRKEKRVGEIPRQTEKKAGEEKKERQKTQQSVERKKEREKTEQAKQEKAEQEKIEWENEGQKKAEWENEGRKRAEWENEERKKAEWENEGRKRAEWENEGRKRAEWESEGQKRAEWENEERKKAEWERGEQKNTDQENIGQNIEMSGNVTAKEEEWKKQPVIKAESMTGAALQRRPPRLQTAAKSIRTGSRQEHKPLYENKWDQILVTYEQIHPYGDNRIYVKLEPKDFIVLRENYQHLVNNSFLLHGFYNYRYLILGREKDFYLGVPGVFYEREKMVALMFGFEAFECEGGEAEEGKFGYYLRKVEL